MTWPGADRACLLLVRGHTVAPNPVSALRALSLTGRGLKPEVPPRRPVGIHRRRRMGAGCLIATGLLHMLGIAMGDARPSHGMSRSDTGRFPETGGCNRATKPKLNPDTRCSLVSYTMTRVFRRAWQSTQDRLWPARAVLTFTSGETPVVFASRGSQHIATQGAILFRSRGTRRQHVPDTARTKQ
jgi:hypothetical protein